MNDPFTITYTSALPYEFLGDLEELLYFHPEQGRFQKTIIDSVNKYGMPRIVNEENLLYIVIGELGRGQSVFALGRRQHENEHTLKGLILFQRMQKDELRILHWVVAPDFLWNGEYGHMTLACNLIENVKSTARRIKGVHRVRLQYQQGKYLSWNLGAK